MERFFVLKMIEDHHELSKFSFHKNITYISEFMQVLKYETLTFIYADTPHEHFVPGPKLKQKPWHE